MFFVVGVGDALFLESADSLLIVRNYGFFLYNGAHMTDQKIPDTKEKNSHQTTNQEANHNENTAPPETETEKQRYDGALRRKQLSLILSGKMKPNEAAELKALFVN